VDAFFSIKTRAKQLTLEKGPYELVRLQIVRQTSLSPKQTITGQKHLAVKNLFPNDSKTLSR